MRLAIAALPLMMLALCPPCQGAERYICAANHATGFRWDGSSWTAATFQTADEKFIVSDLTPEQKLAFKNENYKIGLTYLGKSAPFTYCNTPGPDNIVCDFMYNVRINTITLRYVQAYLFGYVGGDDNNNDTPALTIGSCSKLN